MTSALEHRIPELAFTNEQNPGDAISAVKALTIAAQQGKRIYQITSANENVLDELSIGVEIKDEIHAAVAVGKEATVSESTITVAGWTGTGYIISDPATGAGAYRISGGSNGCIMRWQGYSGMTMGFVWGFGLAILGIVELTFGALMLGLVIVLTVLIVKVLQRSANEAFSECFNAGLASTVAIGALLAALIIGGPLIILVALIYIFLGLMFGDSLPALASCLREDGCCEEGSGAYIVPERKPHDMSFWLRTFNGLYHLFRINHKVYI